MSICEEPYYIAHLKQSCTGEWLFQSNADHLNAVAQLAEQFSQKIGLGEWGRAIGLLHDKGKEQDAFQRYIRLASGYKTIQTPLCKVPHAYVGACVAKQLYKSQYPFISYPIAGHHAGLKDVEVSDFNESIPDEVSNDNSALPKTLSLPETKIEQPYYIHHIIRFLFSCLVDADYLDTESFMDEEKSRLRGCKANMTALQLKLEAYLKGFGSAPQTDINQIRQAIQLRCRDMAEKASGFYSLTVPTGGGKTLSSMVWAINHAIKNHLERIIIAIPYTSIVTQTASVLRTIFGDENVLEHHSNNIDTSTDSEVLSKRTLATENWDYPIIVTTNVQLLESMFSNRPSQCRKLHNLAQSVVILDEVQTLPLGFMQPILNAFQTYKHYFGTSFLFTTASQPILQQSDLLKKSKLKGIQDPIEEIVPSSWRLYEKMKRVNLHFMSTTYDYDQVASMVAACPKVLCIVSTRRDAQELYSRMPIEEGVVTMHLSRMMCSAHLRKVIDEVKEMLKDPQIKLRVIATQLVEAGVDLDFPVVYRQDAGLDSVLQAAGRCNREGKLQGLGDVYVFNFKHPLPSGALSKNHAARVSMKNEYDPFSPEAMKEYFHQVYSRVPNDDQRNGFDVKHIGQLLGENGKQMPQMKTASEEFRLIEEKGISVIVNYEQSALLIERLKKEGPSYQIMKILGLYSVNISDKQFKDFLSKGLIIEVIEGVYYLYDSAQYDPVVGVKFENHWIDEILIK